MEKSILNPDLQSIVDRFARFRDEFTTLKTHYVAQEEIIRIQKMELEKMNSRVKQLATALYDYQRRSNATVRNLGSEIQRLEKIIENSRDNDNDHVLQVHRENNEQVRRLEDELAELRSRIDGEKLRHQREIDSLKKLYNEEINVYKEKLEGGNTLVKNQGDEILSCKKKLDENNEALRKSLFRSNNNKKQPSFDHPAFDDGGKSKRKKSGSALSRLPPLDFTVKKEAGGTEGTVPQMKKKKLYQSDNEATVEL